MTATSDTPDLSYQHVRAARKAGASIAFAAVLSADPDALGVDRNLTAERFVRHVGSDPIDVERVESFPGHSGHFIGALWDGDLAEALYRADVRNSKTLLRLFSEDLWVAALATDRGSQEAGQRFYDEQYDRYGWPDDE